MSYDLGEMFDAYQSAKGDGPFVPFSLFAEEYDGDAKNDFLDALHNGDVSVVEKKHGIRLDGSWPKHNVGRLWLEFDY